MKRNSELLTDAQTIKNETSSGANTAARVGGQIEQMVNRLDRCDIRRPDSSAHYKTLRPIVSFKHDYIYTNWPTTPAAYAAVNGVSVPLTFFVPTEKVWRETPLYGPSTTISFTAPTTEPAADGEINDASANFVTAGVKAGMAISFNGSTSNDVDSTPSVATNPDRCYIVKTVAATKLTIMGTADGPIYDVVDEAAGASITMYRGIYNHLTFSDLHTLIDAGHDIGCYNKTGRRMIAYGNWASPTDAELWEEIYGAKRDMEAGLLADGCTYEVTMLVAPGGNNDARSRRFARQAGYKLCDGMGYDQTVFVHQDSIINPWQNEELNTNIAVNPANAKAGTVTIAAGTPLVLTGDGTTFTAFSDGDPIIVTNSTGAYVQFRIIDHISSDTSLTVTEAFDIAIASGGLLFDPLTETPDATLSYQPIIGYVNSIVTNGGWLIAAGHAGFAEADLVKNLEGATLKYVKYLQDAGKDISIESMSDAYDAYAPLIEGGPNFSVNDDGMRLSKARSKHFTLDDDKVKIGYRAGMSDEGTSCVYLGARATARNDTIQTTVIGHEGSYLASGTSPSYCTLLGYRAGYMNSGKNVVAIGVRAAYQNTEDNVLIISSRGDNNYANPLIKGYFATGGIILGAPAAANKVADASIPVGRFSVRLSADGNSLEFRVCTATSTYKTGSVEIS